MMFNFNFWGCRNIICGFVVIVLQTSFIWGQNVANITKQSLANGDFLFQDLDCGPECDAIESVTQSYNGQSFSHVGIVEIKNDSVWVIEALPPAVKRTPLHQFLQRSNHAVYVGRLSWSDEAILKVVGFCQSQIGIPYDHSFLLNNQQYYCSELLYDALQSVDSSQTIIQLFPMTFKQPGESEFYPTWKEHFGKLNQSVPEGELGCNPGGISRSAAIKMFVLRP